MEIWVTTVAPPQCSLEYPGKLWDLLCMYHLFHPTESRSIEPCFRFRDPPFIPRCFASSSSTSTALWISYVVRSSWSLRRIHLPFVCSLRADAKSVAAFSHGFRMELSAKSCSVVEAIREIHCRIGVDKNYTNEVPNSISTPHLLYLEH